MMNFTNLPQSGGSSKVTIDGEKVKDKLELYALPFEDQIIVDKNFIFPTGTFDKIFCQLNNGYIINASVEVTYISDGYKYYGQVQIITNQNELWKIELPEDLTNKRTSSSYRGKKKVLLHQNVDNTITMAVLEEFVEKPQYYIYKLIYDIETYNYTWQTLGIGVGTIRGAADDMVLTENGLYVVTSNNSSLYLEAHVIMNEQLVSTYSDNLYNQYKSSKHIITFEFNNNVYFYFDSLTNFIGFSITNQSFYSGETFINDDDALNIKYSKQISFFKENNEPALWVDDKKHLTLYKLNIDTLFWEKYYDKDFINYYELFDDYIYDSLKILPVMDIAYNLIGISIGSRINEITPPCECMFDLQNCMHIWYKTNLNDKSDLFTHKKINMLPYLPYGSAVHYEQVLSTDLIYMFVNTSDKELSLIIRDLDGYFGYDSTSLKILCPLEQNQKWLYSTKPI